MTKPLGESDAVVPDAIYVFVRNLKVGMFVVGEGTVDAVREHAPDYFDVTRRGVTLAMPGGKLALVTTKSAEAVAT